MLKTTKESYRYVKSIAEEVVMIWNLKKKLYWLQFNVDIIILYKD